MSIKFIQLSTCKLAEFVSDSATEFDVSGFLYNDGVTPVDPADIGDVCFATLEPKTAREELISFTISSVTAGGVATITATRGLSQKSPYGTGGAAFDHQNGSDFVISNNPGLFNKLAAKANDETITGSWKFPTTPSHVQNPVPKGYFDDNAVKLTGDETVAGVKTFSSSPKIPDSSEDDEAVTRGEFDAEAVTLTGAQTVAGVKTFSSAPKVPDATADDEPFTKGQFDSAASAAAANASETIRGAVEEATDAEVTAGTATGGTGAKLFVTPAKLKTYLGGIGYFGDGSDGAATISSGTTTLTKDMFYTDLTVNGTGVLDCAGYRIHVSGTLTVDSTSGATIKNNGGNGGNASVGTGGTAGTAAPGVTVPASLAGVAGADGRNTNGVGTAGTTGLTSAFSIGVVGVAGGAGGNDGFGGGSFYSPGAAGAAGTRTIVTKFVSIADTVFARILNGSITPFSLSSGSGSGGSGASNNVTTFSGGGGGSGAAGGVVLIFAKTVVLTGSTCISANGGNGGNGGNASGSNQGGGGGGGGGAGGVVILVYGALTGSASNITVAGGTGGTGGAGGGGGATSGASGTTGTSGAIVLLSV